jgi:hypothetical protein
MIDRETLTDMAMDEETRAKLAAAAKTYVEAPANLRAAIIESGRKGDRPADIVKAIGYAFTYDYVARLVRQDRGPSKPATTTALKKRAKSGAAPAAS